MTALKEARAEAEAKLSARIAEGHQIAASDWHDAAELRSTVTKWDDYNRQLLSSLFTDNTEAEAYDAQTTIHAVRHERDQLDAEMSRVRELTVRLESVLERLDLFPDARGRTRQVSASADRIAYLTALYELTGGDPQVAVHSRDVGERAGLSEDIHRHAEAYLKAEGLVTYVTFGPTVSLTHAGRKHHESGSADEAPASTGNVTNIIMGDVSDSAIVVGEGTATVTPPDAELTSMIQGWMESVRGLDLGQLPEPVKETVEASLASMDAQLAAPAPDPGMLGRGMRVIQRVLENTAGSLGAQTVLMLGAQIIGKL